MVACGQASRAVAAQPSAPAWVWKLTCICPAQLSPSIRTTQFFRFVFIVVSCQGVVSITEGILVWWLTTVNTKLTFFSHLLQYTSLVIHQSLLAVALAATAGHNRPHGTQEETSAGREGQ